MCNNHPAFTATKTEREALEESLKRIEAAALKREWCEDTVRVIAAARKYLDILPKPRRKVQVTQYAIMLHGHDEPWAVYSNVDRALATARASFWHTQWDVVPLEGIWDAPV